MGSDFALGEPVEVKGGGARLGHRGWIADRLASNRPLYGEFADKCIAYFERCELEKAPLEVTATNWEAKASK